VKTRANRQAFSLVEITVALGVAAISLLVVFSLLPIGLQTNQRAIEETASVDILSVVAADLRATPRGSGNSLQFGISIPSNPVTSSPPATELFFNNVGQFASSQQSDSRYRMTITFLPNGGGAKTATFVDLKVTWPAGAAITNAQGSAEMFAAFDRN
jgi:uncharacterized protein (TIGR02598 family)